MPLNEYKYLKKTDKGQHIDLATGKSKDDKVFDAMNAVADKTDVEKSLKGDTKEAAHAALMAGGFIPGPVGVVAPRPGGALAGDGGLQRPRARYRRFPGLHPPREGGGAPHSGAVTEATLRPGETRRGLP